MSRTWFGRNDGKRASGSRRRAQSANGSRGKRCLELVLQELESRTLLAVTYTVSGSTITFTGLAQDSLYLETAPGPTPAAGTLEYHDETSNTFTPVQATPTTLFNLTAQDTTIQVYVGGTLHLDGLSSSGKAVSIEGPSQESGNPQATVAVENNIDTQGGNLSITDFASLTVGTTGSNPVGATISTRNTGGSTAYATAPSAGNSGSLTITVDNPDPFNPIPFADINSSMPSITLDAGSALYAQADTGQTAGQITLHATNTNYTLDGLAFPTITAAERSSSITLDAATSAATAAVIDGGGVDIEATSGDVPIVADLISHQGENSNNEFGSWGQWVAGLLNGAFMLVNDLPVLNLIKLPVSINYRTAASTITVGQYAQIVGSGLVNVQSSSTADAEGQALYSSNTTFGAAIAFMDGTTNAVTDVQPNALIASTGGNVAIGSTASSTATGTARVTQNTTAGTTNPNNMQVSLSIGVVNQTSINTIQPGAMVRAAGGVDFESNGTSSNTNMPSATSYTDGAAGIAAGINVTTNDIEANVDGTIIAGVGAGGSTSPTATDVPYSVTFNPFTEIDFANSAIRVSSQDEVTPPPTPVGQPSVTTAFQTGQQIVYNGAGGGSITGLNSGSTYYVIVNSSLPNEIQLASSLTNAMQGIYINFGNYPTLTGLVDGASTTYPITAISGSPGTINFPYNPGFTDGEPVVFGADSSQLIDGLSDQTTYYAIVNPASPDSIQLAAAPQVSGADGPALSISLATAVASRFIQYGQYPTLSGLISGVSTPIPITDVDDSSNTIDLGFNPGFTDGEALVYNDASDKRIGGLVNGTTYYAIVNPASPTTLQLSATPKSGNTDGTPVALNLNPYFQQLQQNLAVIVNPTGGLPNSINFGFNAGFQLNDNFVYQGSSIAGLTDGDTYWVISNSSDPDVIQLASSAANATASPPVPVAISYQAGGSSGPTLTFDPSVSVDAINNTVSLGVNYANVPAAQQSLANGTALVYHGALGTFIQGLVDGGTYYVIEDPADPQIMRLTSAGAAEATSAYNAGLTAYNAQYNAAYNAAYNAYLAANPGDTTDAIKAGTAAANAAAAANGTTWTAGAIDAVQVGNAPPVGTFPVTVNAVGGPANSIDFGFDPGLVYNEPIVYDGPSGSNPGIIGLTSGTTYYVRLPAQGTNLGLIQLADSSGNIIPISLASGTTTTVNFASETDDNVSVGVSGPLSNTLTFNNLGDPTTPFDPGYNQGDPFVYEGAVDPSGGDVNINGLTIGQTYYVLLTSTPGIIQLSMTPNGSPIPISLPAGATSTNINYTVPFTPINSNPPVVTPFGSVSSAAMSGAAQTLNPVTVSGITINAALSVGETDFASAAIGSDPPEWSDKLLKPEVAAPSVNSWFSGVMGNTPDSGSNNSGANSSPSSTVAKAPGGTGSSPSFSVTGTFAVLVDLDTVHADVAGTAVLESAADITVSSSLSQTDDTAATGSVSRNKDQGARRRRWRSRSATPTRTSWPPSTTAPTSTPPARSRSPQIPTTRWSSPRRSTASRGTSSTTPRTARTTRSPSSPASSRTASSAWAGTPSTMRPAPR